MPRPNRGPQLVGPVASKGSTTAVYWIEWYERGRQRRRSTGTGDLEEAHRAFADFLAAAPVRGAGEGPRRPDELLVADALSLYAGDRSHETRAPQRIGYAIAALTPFWGDRPVSTIKGATCRLYLKERMKDRPAPPGTPENELYRYRGVAPETVRRELSVLSTALEHCLTEGYLTERPPVTLPPQAEPHDRWLTRQEIAALIRAARRERKARWHLPLFILIGVYTGQRKEAILSLRWTQNTEGGWVDLKSGMIDFKPMGRGQTKKRRSRIPAPRRLLTFLRYARAKTKTDYVIEYQPRPSGKRVRRHEAPAAPRPVADIKHAFATATAGAGLGDGVTPHVLRHTSVTWMLLNGVEPWDVSKYASMSLEMIQRRYGHHAPDYMQGPRDSFDRPKPRSLPLSHKGLSTARTGSKLHENG